MTKVPVRMQSKFEKFCEGLRLIRLYQPAAKLDATPKCILVGEASDEYITEGARKYLRDLGFKVADTRGMFAFPTETD